MLAEDSRDSLWVEQSMPVLNLRMQGFGNDGDHQTPAPNETNSLVDPSVDTVVLGDFISTLEIVGFCKGIMPMPSRSRASLPNIGRGGTDGHAGSP